MQFNVIALALALVASAHAAGGYANGTVPYPSGGSTGTAAPSGTVTPAASGTGAARTGTGSPIANAAAGQSHMNAGALGLVLVGGVAMAL